MTSPRTDSEPRRRTLFGGPLDGFVLDDAKVFETVPVVSVRPKGRYVRHHYARGEDGLLHYTGKTEHLPRPG